MQAGGIEVLNKNLDKVLEAIHSISDSIIRTFEDLSKKPDIATAEFGFKFSAEGNLIFARASGEASLTISLTWNQPTG